MANPPIADRLKDPITQHMRADANWLRGDQTVGEALAAIRRRPPQERIIYFYVVDADQRLIGVVPTRRLLLSELDKPIADIMVQKVVAIPSTATVLDACEFFTLHRLLAFPVVDAERRVIGVVDVELYTAELGDIQRSEQSDDLFQLIGVHLLESQQAAPWKAFRIRFPWLLCNISGGILAAFLAGLFQVELQKAVAIAVFIPVVLALAESVSIQSLSLSLQMLRGRRPTIRGILCKLPIELSTGALLGITSGLMVAVVALAWSGEMRIGWAIFGGIAGGVACSAVIGVAMPNLLRLFHRDPQVAAGPIALAVSDMATLLIYFNLARWLLG